MNSIITTQQCMEVFSWFLDNMLAPVIVALIIDVLSKKTLFFVTNFCFVCNRIVTF